MWTDLKMYDMLFDKTEIKIELRYVSLLPGPNIEPFLSISFIQIYLWRE